MCANPTPARPDTATYTYRPAGRSGPFVEPIVDHDRVEARSITGGYVYRGQRVPELYGACVYTDFVTGLIWALRCDGRKIVDHRRIGQSVGNYQLR